MVQARATAAVFPFFIFCAKEGEKKSRAKKNLVHSHFSSSPTRLESLGPLAFFVLSSCACPYTSRYAFFFFFGASGLCSTQAPTGLH